MNESMKLKNLSLATKEKALREAEKLPISKESQEIVKSRFLDLIKADNFLKDSELFLKMPKTITELVVNDMELNFRGPFQLSLFTFLSFVSAYLLKNNAVINFQNKIITPEIWTLILAPSGAGKSLIEKEIRETLEFESNIFEPDTRAGFF